MRLDNYLLETIKDQNGESYTRSAIANFIKNGMVLVNGKTVKCGYEVKQTDKLEINIKPIETKAVPEDIPLDVVYEDNYLLIVNKPAGMVVHAGAGVTGGTLVNALLGRKVKLSKGTEPMRPGIVHRLDKETSGLMVVAKTDKAHALLSQMLESHQIKRTYNAVCEGVFKNHTGTVNTRIVRHPHKRTEYVAAETGGKIAITHYKVIETFYKTSLVEFNLETGRTHQIRVHCKYLRHPIVGDELYGNKGSRMCLISKKIEFVHPITKENITKEIELPKWFKDFCR